MDKREYLNRLRGQLADLTDEERGEALEYYEEYFADAGEENEEDVICSLGAPEQVAEQIKAGLHKEEKGMFTENGYREKLESDNPPEVYGRSAEKKTRERNGRGPLPWGYEKPKREKYRQEKQQDKKGESMSGGMIALLVVLCIFASPIILGLGAGLIGLVMGILGAAIGVTVALFAVVLSLLAAGIGLCIGGIAMLFVRPFSGMICIAVGCFLLALFLLCLVLLAAIFGRFFPWLIGEVEKLGRYLSRKWSERKGKGEAA